MKRRSRNSFILAGYCLAAFVLWTVLVSFADIQPIGPTGSTVGLATLNGSFHRLTGVHMVLYELTDLLSLVPILTVAIFGFLGLSQWIRRRRLMNVDFSILVLGGFYIVVAGLFLFFEICVVNYRPVLIDGILEASYPSSTTLLVLCVMPTAMMQLRSRIGQPRLRSWVLLFMFAFTGFMVIARLLSGVHWVTDIIGGILLSTGLVALYKAIIHQA